MISNDVELLDTELATSDASEELPLDYVLDQEAYEEWITSTEVYVSEGIAQGDGTVAQGITGTIEGGSSRVGIVMAVIVAVLVATVIVRFIRRKGK